MKIYHVTCNVQKPDPSLSLVPERELHLPDGGGDVNDDDDDDDDNVDDDDENEGDGLPEPGHQRDGRQALLPLRGGGRQAVRARPGAAQGYQHQGGWSSISGVPAAKYTSTRI